MAWRIEIDKDVQRSMKKLDKQIARRIVAKLHEISQLEDPRSMGKGLTENKSGLWRYRVGDYRIVADIEDDVLVILVVDVDHRSKVYRTRRRCSGRTDTCLGRPYEPCSDTRPASCRGTARSAP